MASTPIHVRPVRPPDAEIAAAKRAQIQGHSTRVSEKAAKEKPFLSLTPVKHG